MARRDAATATSLSASPWTKYHSGFVSPGLPGPAVEADDEAEVLLLGLLLGSPHAVVHDEFLGLRVLVVVLEVPVPGMLDLLVALGHAALGMGRRRHQRQRRDPACDPLHRSSCQ